jgi:hypothetical protein
MQQWWNYTEEKIKSTQRKAYPHANLSATNRTQISLGVSLSLHSEKPGTNHLKHGMVLLSTLFAGTEQQLKIYATIS